MSFQDEVRTVQRLLGVAPDGVAGPATIEAMRQALDQLAALKAGPRLAPHDAAAPASATSGPPGGLSAAGAAAGGLLRASRAGIDLIHSFEQCRLEAYPDPGSADGNPWTIGWGSTGPDIRRGITWTQAQADERFRSDLARFEAGIRDAIGDAPTTQAQFDALVSLAYNIGIVSAAGSTVMRRHRLGEHDGAATAFGMWNKNDGQVMRGLVRRRAAEAEMYRGRG
jgi:GH24 family phage-related lysozyme (muramidase)